MIVRHVMYWRLRHLCALATICIAHEAERVLAIHALGLRVLTSCWRELEGLNLNVGGNLRH
jgi:hypothetical protein